MFEEYKLFNGLKFKNRCSVCQKTLDQGSSAYGTNKDTPDGKWSFVCLECYEANKGKAESEIMEAMEGHNGDLLGAFSEAKEKPDTRSFLEIVRDNAPFRFA